MLSAILLVSCSTSVVAAPTLNIGLADADKFIVGQSTLKDVVDSFGQRTTREETDEKIQLNYDDTKTGLPRLSFYFNKSDNKVSAILWIPYKSDEESNLNILKAHLRGTAFVEQKIDEPPVHHERDVVMLIDKGSGYSIRYDRLHDNIEGVLKFSPSIRPVASTDEK